MKSQPMRQSSILLSLKRFRVWRKVERILSRTSRGREGLPGYCGSGALLMSRSCRMRRSTLAFVTLGAIINCLEVGTSDMRTIIECVPNISEGRDRAAIDAVAAAVRGVTGVRLLDVSSDASHNRSVLTFVGDAAAVRAGVLALFEAALPRIDLRPHRGEHPRMGAVDVVPFIPIRGSSVEQCVALSREVGAEVAPALRRSGVPLRGVGFGREAAQPRRRAEGAVRGLRREDEGPASGSRTSARPSRIPRPAPSPWARAPS